MWTARAANIWVWSDMWFIAKHFWGILGEIFISYLLISDTHVDDLMETIFEECAVTADVALLRQAKSPESLSLLLRCWTPLATDIDESYNEEDETFLIRLLHQQKFYKMHSDEVIGWGQIGNGLG